MNRASVVRMDHGRPTTTSIVIAEMFGRSHKNVLQSIDKLIESGSIDRLEIKPMFYLDKYNREQRAYELPERPALIAMPFIGGRRAEEGQVILVDAFLSARDEVAKLRQLHSSPDWQQARIESKGARKAETDVIKAFVNYASSQGSKSASRYYMAISKETNRALFFVQGAVGKGFRDRLTSSQLAALAMAERIVERALLEAMAARMFYRDAYREAASRVRSFSMLVGQTAPGLAPALSLGSK